MIATIILFKYAYLLYLFIIEQKLLVRPFFIAPDFRPYYMPCHRQVSIEHNKEKQLSPSFPPLRLCMFFWSPQYVPSCTMLWSGHAWWTVFCLLRRRVRRLHQSQWRGSRAARVGQARKLVVLDILPDNGAPGGSRFHRNSCVHRSLYRSSGKIWHREVMHGLDV
jgi:hypothetical protein